MNRGVQESLIEAVSALTERERTVVVELYMHGTSYRALAKKLGVDSRTIQRWREKALNKLQAAVTDSFETPTSDEVIVDKVPSLRGKPMSVPYATCVVCGSQAAINFERMCGRCDTADLDTSYAFTLSRA